MTSFIFSARSLLASFLFLLSITFFAYAPNANADDHNERRKRRGKNHLSSLGHDRGDKGDEFTGQFAAWIFAAANLPVALSLIFRRVKDLALISMETKERIKFFNKFQKKHLMRFHYFLNPLAIIIAFLHFSLSSCRTSSLPDWGLTAASTLSLFGVLVKFAVLPKRFRKTIYKIHTSPVPFGLACVLILIGHSIVD